MMAAQPSDVLDPMYNFDTHFPERLSRLHVHGDTFAAPQNSFRKKKNSRANRNAARYKTQPVTFAEILEVDEEPMTSAGVSAAKEAAEKRLSHLDERQFNMNQLQAFSKSLDGLVPANNPAASALPEHFKPNVMLGRSGSFSRTGSRKYLRHPECIPEKVEAESQPKSPQAKQPANEVQDRGEQRLAESGAGSSPSEVTGSNDPGAESASKPAHLEVTTDSSNPPALSPLAAPRRQKMTAKAKKRQKAQAEGEGS